LTQKTIVATCKMMVGSSPLAPTTLDQTRALKLSTYLCFCLQRTNVKSS